MRSYREESEEESLADEEREGIGLEDLGGEYAMGDDPFARMFGGIFTAEEASDKIKDKPPEKNLSVYVDIIQGLQAKLPEELIAEGWQEVTPKEMDDDTESREFVEPKTELRIRFDKGVAGASGFKGKDHYHVYNPLSTNKKNRYLDITGKPVGRGSKASHIVIQRRESK